MALSQSDRIAISKKIIDIPTQDAQATLVQSQLESERVKAENEDLSNKSLMDDKTTLIDLYQDEIERYDGNGRTNLLEQDITDSVNKTLQNPFFPNDPNTALPSTPTGVWLYFNPFSGNKAIGKDYVETYSTVQKEQDLIDIINTRITTVEGFVDATRSSGDEVISNPSPPPTYLKQTSSTMATAATNLISAIQDWEDFLNATYALIPTALQDTDATRTSENNASRSDITNSISIIDTWQALQDFDTVTATPSVQPDFDNFAASNFNPSKFRSTELQAIKDEITARQTFITSRITQITGYLGSITQSLTTGDITATAGLYGDRFRFIAMRLNLMGGSKIKLISLENGQDAQEQIKKNNANAATAYQSVMTATAFRAPGAGTETIHVKDASGFSVSDSVYVVSNTQDEIATTIQTISNNRVVLADSIPKKYRENEGARLYKVL